MTTDTIIRRLKITFSNFGIPETLFVPSMINNEAIQKQLVDNQVKMKNYYDRHTRPADPLSIKDRVWFQKDKRWIPGQITNQAHEPRSFYVKDQEGNENRRNSIHIREDKRNETTHTDWEKQLELSQEQANLQDLEESTSQHSTQPTSSGQLSSPGFPKNVTTTGPPENWTNGSPKNLITTRSEGREDVNDEERAGRPSTSTTDEKINEVEKMILANRRITVREVAEDLNISIGSYHSIFINDLGMRRVAAKFVPKLLNCDQKQHRMNIANEMLDSVRDNPNLLHRVITGDEAWVYGYDVETKAQSSQWKLPHEPRPEKARQVRSNVKVLLKVFFDCRGVEHHEFLPQGRTVNKEYYLQVMRNFPETPGFVEEQKLAFAPR
ncbi:hypothetical protein LAZ67_3004279 [Cordylochernes scorpioides]|uniref:Uncharacterized protein n=1 Tax=Cordylochernes scorpioides TaxID=51811 RepID=A0ABY6KA11_9ARAC|nr:hypothetical protein LAZ67_3004279 [Cordylochernes scorpioides]